MGKRKKKLLFDVFGGIEGIENPPKKLGSLRRESKAAVGVNDVKIPGRLLVLASGVFVVIVGVSYYFGSNHGEIRARKGDIALESHQDRQGGSTPTTAVAEVAPWFAVKAAAKGYSRYTRSELERHMRACCRFLIDEGFEPVDLMEYEKDKKKGTGEFVLWVGNWTEKEASDQVAKKIRGLVMNKNHEFKTAYAAVRR